MTIDYRIQIGHSLTQSDIQKIKEIIGKTFKEINDIHNKWNPNSELTKLNKLPAFEKVPISQELFFLLKIANNVNLLSEGRFDPTVEPLHQIWKHALQKGNIPTSETIENIKPAIGWSKVHFDDTGFWKEHDLTSLDLSGIAKGHLVDLLLERLSATGYSNIYVEWGGEIRVLGQNPNSRPWTIFIKDFQSDKAIAIVPLINEAIATSGDYEHFWEYQDNRYFHVMNPKTFSPLQQSSNSIASASILASSCAFADAIATAALFFDNEQEAKEWLDNLPVKYWLKTRQATY